MLRLRRHFLALAVTVAALAVPASASAGQPSCGDSLTSDVQLAADLDCSGYSGDALTIEKKGVTVDLNGFTLTGPGSDDYYGVYAYARDNVTVENGTVEGYEYGVYISYGDRPKIVDVEGDNDSGDFYVEYSTRGKLQDVSGSAPEYPIYLYENEKVNVVGGKVNGGTGAYGVYDYYSHSTIKGVKATGNYYGIYVTNPYRGYKVLGNKANGNSENGIYVYSNYPTRIYQATVSDNVANDNGAYGLFADVTTPGSGNSASGNGTADCHHVKC